jgi:hypothetical protein
MNQDFIAGDREVLDGSQFNSHFGIIDFKLTFWTRLF